MRVRDVVVIPVLLIGAMVIFAWCTDAGDLVRCSRVCANYLECDLPNRRVVCGPNGSQDVRVVTWPAPEEECGLDAQRRVVCWPAETEDSP